VIIGVTGDTHNNLKNIKNICTIFNKNGADLVFHTGDVTLPKSLLAFEELNCPLEVVLGNNDIQEKESLMKASMKFNCKIRNEPYYTVVDEKKITVLHHPELINEEIISNSDLILHGHTHRYRLEKKADTIIFNPGECAGFMKDKNQIGIIDLLNLSPKIINF
tara:strand:- start:2399 stop:2887 length:489 start_codon:yes stop_codon:yes gene_type:complete